jgi:hypothetical protein
MEGAMACIREALRLDPDDGQAKSTFKQIKHFKSLVDQAKQAMLVRQFEAAVQLYTTLIDTLRPPPPSPVAVNAYASRGMAQPAPKRE